MKCTRQRWGAAPGTLAAASFRPLCVPCLPSALTLALALPVRIEHLLHVGPKVLVPFGAI